MKTNPPAPMLAKAADPAGAGSPVVSSRSVRRPGRPEPELDLPPDADPGATVERILALLSDDRYLPARRLAAEAVRRFPEHERVQWAWNIFDPHGKATVSELGPQPSRDEEFEWLRHPPQWAQGKWVALVGREVVAMSETLEDVAASVRSQNLPKRPLVHRID